jgi:phosphoglycerate dehydrogenase-like enzyme
LTLTTLDLLCVYLNNNVLKDFTMRVAVLDDWQGIARSVADWSYLSKRAEIAFFTEAFTDEADAARKLADFDILMVMRERTAFPASLIAQLPKMKFFAMTGRRAASIDFQALARHNVVVSYSDGINSAPATAEIGLALMLSAARGIPVSDRVIRDGGFQAGVPAGFQLAGKTIGIIGLGRLGSRMARYAAALEMNILAWSPNLTAERAAEAGARLVTKEALLRDSDVVSLHVVLSPQSKGLIGAAELAQMKTGAILVNTSRGPLVDETALITAVRAGRIIAALDVYDSEPLPPDHPMRGLPGTVLTPHLGYATSEVIGAFYREGIENVLAFLDGTPIRVLK